MANGVLLGSRDAPVRKRTNAAKLSDVFPFTSDQKSDYDVLRGVRSLLDGHQDSQGSDKRTLQTDRGLFELVHPMARRHAGDAMIISINTKTKHHK